MTTTKSLIPVEISVKADEVWDDSVAPGGYVCATCGMPTESEPCAAHGDRPLTKSPQRPHHWMNLDGFCHAGDMFEVGSPAIPLYTFEQMQAWVLAERAAIESGRAS